MSQLLTGNREIAYNLDGKQDFIYSEMMKKFEALSDHVKRLDGQFANNAVNIRREKGFLPRKTDINPKSNVNAVTLRSGRQLNQNVKEGITIDEFVGIKHAEKDDSHPILVDTPKYNTILFPETEDTDQGDELEEQNSDLGENEVQSEDEESDARHQHNINRHPKDAATKGFETTEHHVMMVGEDISAEILGNKPAKLQDPGSFVLDCNIHSGRFQRSLCDLGSSVNLMPYSVAKALGLTEFKPTKITLILADRSVRVPEGILEDVPIKINDCVIPADFVILKYEKEPKDPLTFHRSNRCMMSDFTYMIEDFMEVFMDDFSVYGSDFTSCLNNLFKVLAICEAKNLVLNREKCRFMVNDGIVLGHKVSAAGIEVDRAKIEVMTSLPAPTNVKDIRSFLWHAGFYRRFIKDFRKIARPLTELLCKEVKFEFTPECLEAFKEIKSALVSAPIFVEKGQKAARYLLC
ncbi:hypothetical protein N665_0571s0002 [Sinapis alba]|nr:hypothetical protein N665_0571s0002 [Sinapis alba]